MIQKKRIWELDALRGLCILGMLVFHLLFNITELLGLVSWHIPRWLIWVADMGARLFLLLSGLCVTLGSRPLRRGLTVLGCGMVCTAVTWIMYRLGLSGSGMVIRFGILHCLGVCMLAWPVFRKLPLWLVAGLGAAMLAGGWYLDAFDVRVSVRWLFPLGLPYGGFSSGDYYPLLPGLGWFLLGAVLGRTLYATKQTRLPRVDPALAPIAFLRFCGRHSLPIYLLHQPLFFAVLTLLKDGSL